MIPVLVGVRKNLRNVVASKISQLLPKRSKFSNKLSGGKVLIIGGGSGLYGAGLLSALAATRAGAGYTHLMTDLSKFPWLKFPDFIVHHIKLSELKNKKDFAIGIGPGLGVNEKKLKLINYLIKNNFRNVVADADALTLISKNNISHLPESWILTPHEGEMARLLKVHSSIVKKNRIGALKAAQKKFKCTILLKGATTLISSPQTNKIIAVKTGTPALSKAGTGDVLLGMIVAFRAQGLDSVDASFLATYVHGKVAQDFEADGNDILSLRPIDLIERLPKTLKVIRQQK